MLLDNFICSRFLGVSAESDGRCTDNDKDHAHIVVEAEPLPVDDPVNDRCNQRLHRPNRRDHAHIHSTDVREVHRHEDGAHNTQEQATHDQKQDQVRHIQLAVDNDIVPVPHVVHRRIHIVLHRHADLEDDAGDPRAKTEVEDARQAVDVVRDLTDD